MSEILEFIKYVNDYLDDDYREYIDFIGAENYFTHGGCYEFAKIIKHFIPSAIIYRSNPKSEKYYDHIIVKIGDNYYNATGIIPNPIAESEFYEVSDEELEIIPDFIGIPEVNIEGISIDNIIINETKLVISESPGKSIDKLLTTINENIANTEKTIKYSKKIL